MTASQNTFMKQNCPNSNQETYEDCDGYYSARTEDSIDHPRLNRIRKDSRLAAELEHAQKNKGHQILRRHIISKVKTRRQASNKKSAEICRYSKLIYINNLEHELGQEEDDYLQIMQSIFEETENIMKTREQIRRIRDAREKESREQSWLSCLQPTERDDDTMNDLFPGSEEIQPVIDDFSHFSYESSDDETITTLDEDMEDDVEQPMDQLIEERKVPRSERQSPISIYATSQYVPELNCLAPSAQ